MKLQVAMERNCCHLVAPSMRAASYSSGEMFCRPAR